MIHDPQRRAYGPTVHALRLARGLLLAELADTAGRSVGLISKIENRRVVASAEATDQLAAALGVTREVLTGQVPAIAALRTQLGVSADGLAAAAGLTTSQLQQIEAGGAAPQPEVLSRIAVRLGVAPAALGPSFDVTPAAAS